MALASDLDEFKVKREGPFAFAEKPSVARQGDKVTITFETKAYCDVTVAIEAMEHGLEKGSGTLPLRSPTPFPQVAEPFFRGRIVRHLASGVLGPNAPEPFQKNAKRQVIVWDGKDDQGTYIDDQENYAVRVSLGLQPHFERALVWSPHKRISQYSPIIRAVPEGVVVCEGHGVDHVRLFDHQGNCLRTIYPFPAKHLDQVLGLEKRVFPQDGKEWPVKRGFVQASLLTSGTSSVIEPAYKFGDGFAATAMAVRGTRIAIADRRLNRLTLDGTSGGLPLTAPRTALTTPSRREGRNRSVDVSSSSMAFAPDGRTLYLTGYLWKEPCSYIWYHFGLRVVMKMDFEGDLPPTMFAGTTAFSETSSASPHLTCAVSVDVDDKGRVYVADFPEDRVQVFSPEGALLKTIRTRKPAFVRIHPGTQEIYVGSWIAPTGLMLEEPLKPTLARFGPFDDPKPLDLAPLPFEGERISKNYGGWPLQFSAELGGYAAEPTFWVVGQKQLFDRKQVVDFGMGVLARAAEVPGPSAATRWRSSTRPTWPCTPTGGCSSPTPATAESCA